MEVTNFWTWVHEKLILSIIIGAIITVVALTFLLDWISKKWEKYKRR
jgi:uncharacterized membrane protein YjgN (DUF898 family)